MDLKVHNRKIPKHRCVYMCGLVYFFFEAPGGSVVKNPPASAGGVSLIPGSGRPTGGGNGILFQYSYWENPMDRGAWQATVHGVSKRQA